MKKNNIPNILTLVRLIAFIPFIVFLVLYQKFTLIPRYQDSWIWTLMVAMAIFILAMITDFLDGYIARKTKNISTFGKVFDPIGDKLMTSSALVFLALYGFTELWIAVIFIVRDIIVDGSRNLAATKKIEIAASIWGKLKTLVQSFAIILLFILGPLIEDFWWIYWIINVPIFIALFLSLFSGWLYVQKIVPYLFKNKSS